MGSPENSSGFLIERGHRLTLSAADNDEFISVKQRVRRVAEDIRSDAKFFLEIPLPHEFACFGLECMQHPRGSYGE